jgi:hypothetical protein
VPCLLLLQYQRWQLRYNEFITLGAHVSAAMASELNITTRWAVPVFRLRKSLAHAVEAAGAGAAATAVAEVGTSSGSGSPCRAYVSVQGKMDGRRALSPLWAGLEQAGMGQQQAGMCVQVGCRGGVQGAGDASFYAVWQLVPKGLLL